MEATVLTFPTMPVPEVDDDSPTPGPAAPVVALPRRRDLVELDVERWEVAA